MFFRKQKFFLDLTSAEDKEKGAQAPEAKVTIAPPKPAAAKPAPAKAAAAPAATAPTPAAAPATAAPAAAAPAAEPTPAAVRTTAEEIAAQLAAEAASRPAPTLATFAPDCLVPGGANPRRRRTAGANLGPFKEIARGMMKS
ncbi:MAG: hypothetical protein VKO44_08410 [Cyanobacteriota bacterium]|jgi:hypothetical protein|nr:hypothetical protein [Cyanobacteriota bacterium]